MAPPDATSKDDINILCRSSLTSFERVTLNPAGDPVACECLCAQSNKSFLHMDFFLPNTCIPNAAEIWKTVTRVWWVCSPMAASSCYRWWSRGREGGRQDQGVRTAHTLWVRSRFTARDRKSTATLSRRRAISSPTEAEKGRFGCDENARIHNGDETQNSSERTKVPMNHCGGADS